MTWAPNHGLPGQKRNGAPFMRALRAERMQLIAGLQNQHALPAHWSDDKLVLLEFGDFIARQTRRPRSPGLRQRLEIANNWISDADQPAEEARAQKKIEKMTARGYRSCCGLFVHRRCSIRRRNLFQVFTQRADGATSKNKIQQRADCCTDKYLWMPAAALRLSRTARTTRSGPRTRSPPANTPGTLVI